MDLEKIKEKWQKKGLICELYELAPQDSWSDPGHKTEEYFLLLEGEIEIFCQGQTIHPAIEEEIMIPAKKPHIVKNNGSKTSQVLWIHHANY